METKTAEEIIKEVFGTTAQQLMGKHQLKQIQECMNFFASQQKPEIKYPSQEEIDAEDSKMESNYGFGQGAQWMIEQIKILNK